MSGIKAKLYMDDILQRSIVIPCRCRYIRIASNHSPMYSIYNQAHEHLDIDEFNIFVYQLTEKEGFDEYRYEFSGIEKVNISIPEDSFDIGFSEPNENVNLEKVKSKLRDNIDLKKQLLKFYQRR